MTTREAAITALLSFWTVFMMGLGMASVTSALAGILAAIIGSFAIIGFIAALACIALGIL